MQWVVTGAKDRLKPRLAMMAHPEILPGFTEAGAHVRNLGYYDGALSLLKQAIATKFISPEKAISRVNGEPAQWLHLNAGVIEVGVQADLVLIYPEALIDRQDAIFSWRASRCLGLMFVRILLGKYSQDIQQRQQSLNDYRSRSQTTS